jgi:hypothetical protein
MQEDRQLYVDYRTLNCERKSKPAVVAQVDRLEDELVAEQEKFKAITEELEQTFAEMSGY